MKELTELLDKLAQQLGVTAAQLWPYLIRDQVVSWWSKLALAAICLIATLIMGTVVRPRLEEGGEARAMAVTATVVFTFLTFVALVVAATDINQLLVPEAAALHRLIGR